MQNKKVKTINISLPVEMVDFIDKEKKKKYFKTYAEYIRELIRQKMEGR